MEKGMHRALTQIVAVALVGIGIVLIPGGISWAQSGQGTPTVYKMTIKELCFNTTGDSVFPTNLCFVPGTQDQEFDLAAVAANAIAGSMNFTVAAATYIQARATISCTFGLKGTVTDLSTGTVYKTIDTGGGTGGTSTAAGSPAEAQYKLPDAQCDTPTADSGKGRNVRTSGVISLNLGGNVDMVSNVTNGLFLDSGVLRPGNFSISIH